MPGWSVKTEETSAPKSDLDAIQKVCQGLARGEAQAHEFDGIIAAAGQAAAEKEAAEAAVDYNYLPVRKVSHDQGVIPAPAPQPAAPKTAEAAAAGGIQRYRDAQGVLHLSNAAPGAEERGPAVQMAQSPNNQGGEARQLGQPPAARPRLPIRQAAWSPDERRLATLPTTSSPARKAAPGESEPHSALPGQQRGDPHLERGPRTPGSPTLSSPNWPGAGPTRGMNRRSGGRSRPWPRPRAAWPGGRRPGTVKAASSR